MPVVYETTLQMAEKGRLTLDLRDLPFEKGTRFAVKLIPQPSNFDAESFKNKMQSFIDKCSQNNPLKGRTKEQILAELRQQREEMYAPSTVNQP